MCECVCGVRMCVCVHACCSVFVHMTKSLLCASCVCMYAFACKCVCISECVSTSTDKRVHVGERMCMYVSLFLCFVLLSTQQITLNAEGEDSTE